MGDPDRGRAAMQMGHGQPQVAGPANPKPVVINYMWPRWKPQPQNSTSQYVAGPPQPAMGATMQSGEPSPFGAMMPEKGMAAESELGRVPPASDSSSESENQVKKVKIKFQNFGN